MLDATVHRRLPGGVDGNPRINDGADQSILAGRRA
jgi:hypothetical protein